MEPNFVNNCFVNRYFTRKQLSRSPRSFPQNLVEINYFIFFCSQNIQILKSIRSAQEPPPYPRSRIFFKIIKLARFHWLNPSKSSTKGRETISNHPPVIWIRFGLLSPSKEQKIWRSGSSDRGGGLLFQFCYKPEYRGTKSIWECDKSVLRQVGKMFLFFGLFLLKNIPLRLSLMRATGLCIQFAVSGIQQRTPLNSFFYRMKNLRTYYDLNFLGLRCRGPIWGGDFSLYVLV